MEHFYLEGYTQISWYLWGAVEGGVRKRAGKFIFKLCALLHGLVLLLVQRLYYFYA